MEAPITMLSPSALLRSIPRPTAQDGITEGSSWAPRQQARTQQLLSRDLAWQEPEEEMLLFLWLRGSSKAGSVARDPSHDHLLVPWMWCYQTWPAMPHQTALNAWNLIFSS